MNCFARRYVPEGADLWLACPLWDVHLYASTWGSDRLADRVQYAALLMEVGRSPRLERVGWLKVSFFRTPVYDFLRTGHFPNVETLVLNAGPFPDVLEAVAENESFRSLRYVQFGSDQWAWAPGYVDQVRFSVLEGKLRAANAKHLPFGEMRTALRAIMRDTPLPPAQTIPVAIPEALQTPMWREIPANAGPPASSSETVRGIVGLLLAVLIFGSVAVRLATTRGTQQPTAPVHQFNYDPDKYKLPPAVYDLVPKKEPTPPGAERESPKDQKKGFVGPPEPSERKD
jgi:hypothetical protein